MVHPTGHEPAAQSISRQRGMGYIIQMSKKKLRLRNSLCYTSYIFIAHDLSVVEYMSDRIAVMYLGKVVETAPAKQFSTNCRHPYAQALMSAVPIPKLNAQKEEIILSGDVPSPIHPPKGCRFHPRCRYCTERCKQEEPVLRPVDGTSNHMVACHLLDK